MALLNRNNHPPGGGYSFYQPQTKWFLKGGLPFPMAVQAIVQHRLANPALKLPTDPETVADELDAYTCARLKNDPNWCNSEKKKTESLSFLPPVSPAFNVPQDRPVAQPAAAGADVLKRAGQVVGGIATISSWLGKGAQVVDQSEAERRAFICSSCPKNVRGSLLESVIGVVADAIQGAVSLKNHLKLRTQMDEHLGTCDACGCHLPLKVWVSDDVIAESLTEEILRECVPQCWMRKLSSLSR